MPYPPLRNLDIIILSLYANTFTPYLMGCYCSSTGTEEWVEYDLPFTGHELNEVFEKGDGFDARMGILSWNIHNWLSRHGINFVSLRPY